MKVIGFDEKSIAYIIKKNELEKIKEQLKLMSENKIEDAEEQMEFINSHLNTKKNKTENKVLNMIGELWRDNQLIIWLPFDR